MGHTNPLLSGGLLPGGHGAVEGIRVPEGDPDGLRRAATTWAHAGDVLERNNAAINRATIGAALAAWEGIASMAFVSAAQDLTRHMRRGARQCDSAAAACRQLAGALDDAQEQARRAITAALEARERIEEARQAVDTNTATARDADRSAVEARALADAARNSGPPNPLTEAGAQKAENQERTARAQAQEARASARRAQQRMAAAEDDLERARRRGQDALHDAKVAGRRAAMALHSVAAAATAPPRFGRPVPSPIAGGPLADSKVFTWLGVSTSLGTGPASVFGDATDGVLAGDKKRLMAARRRAMGSLDEWGRMDPSSVAKLYEHELKTTRNPTPNRTRWTTAGRTLSRGLGALNAVMTWEENRKKGMSTAENGLRTGASVAAGSAAAGAAGAACAPGGPVASGACGVAAGYLGSKAGDWAAGVTWDLGTVAVDGIGALIEDPGQVIDGIVDLVDPPNPLGLLR